MDPEDFKREFGNLQAFGVNRKEQNRICGKSLIKEGREIFKCGTSCK